MKKQKITIAQIKAVKNNKSILIKIGKRLDGSKKKFRLTEVISKKDYFLENASDTAAITELEVESDDYNMGVVNIYLPEHESYTNWLQTAEDRAEGIEHYNKHYHFKRLYDVVKYILSNFECEVN